MGGMNTQHEADHLPRIFSSLQFFWFALTFMISWEVVAMNMSAAFLNGGPRALIWGTLCVVAGALVQAASLAELASDKPVAGAQYRWTYALAPHSRRRVLTWMQGWCTWFAWVSALAGSSSSTANIILGLVRSRDVGYTYHPWHLTLLIIAQLAVAGIINTLAFRSVPWMESCAGMLHVVLWIVFVVILLQLPSRQSAEFVFWDSHATSGWDTKFVEWNLGLLVPAWGFIGFDGVAHMSEEVVKTRSAVPWAMFGTILVNGLLAFGMSLVLLFCMPDVDDVLRSPYPIIPICFRAAGIGGGTAMVVALVILKFCVLTASLASVSRITWAWARDGALPSRLRRIHARFQVPVAAIWTPVLMVSLLALTTVQARSATAFSAFTALSSLGLYSSYVIVFVCQLIQLVSDGASTNQLDHFERPVWAIPRPLGFVVKSSALCWTLYVIIWLPLPTVLPISAGDMNYAGPIYILLLGFSGASWIFWGRTKWPGLSNLDT